jgi:hypothetical protein
MFPETNNKYGNINSNDCLYFSLSLRCHVPRINQYDSRLNSEFIIIIIIISSSSNSSSSSIQLILCFAIRYLYFHRHRFMLLMYTLQVLPIYIYILHVICAVSVIH